MIVDDGFWGPSKQLPSAKGTSSSSESEKGLTATEEHRLAAECFDRGLDLMQNGCVSDGRYQWEERGGVLWIQLIDGTGLGLR